MKNESKKELRDGLQKVNCLDNCLNKLNKEGFEPFLIETIAQLWVKPQGTFIFELDDFASSRGFELVKVFFCPKGRKPLSVGVGCNVGEVWAKRGKK